MSNIVPQSNLTAAIHNRDLTCRVTAFESGTQVAHLIPNHERQWFLSNSMDIWNIDRTLDTDNLLRDASNAVLLRSDIHSAFDQRQFVFFPKDTEGFALHMLEPTSDIGQLYHNTRVRIHQCSLEFLYTRFAWSIFPSLAGFLSRPGKSRLVVRLNADSTRLIEEVPNSITLARRAAASRSNSPTKRSRVAAGLEEGIECSKRARVSGSRNYEPSFDYTLPTLEDDSNPERQASHTMDSLRSTTHTNALGVAELSLGGMKYSGPDPDDIHIAELRQEALKQQRPHGYNPERPPYDRHRPAREELELMGVEIIEDLDAYESGTD